MSFLTNEISNFFGKPVLLYTFTRASETWRYAGGNRDITLDSNTYTAKAITCGPLVSSGDAQADEVTITVPASLAFVRQFVDVPPSERVGLTIRRYHKDDTDSVVVWAGRVDRARQVDASKTAVIATCLLDTMKRAGLRLPWNRQCGHMIYDPGCTLSKADFANSAVVESVTGVTLVAGGLAAAPAGSLRNGFIEWVTPEGVKMWRMITAHSTNAIELHGGTRNIEVGDTIVAYRGCGRGVDACNAFGNLANYGGFPNLPSKSPFDGNPVF